MLQPRTSHLPTDHLSNMSASTLTAPLLDAKLSQCDQAIRQGLRAGTIAAEMAKMKDDLVSKNTIQ